MSASDLSSFFNIDLLTFHLLNPQVGVVTCTAMQCDCSDEELDPVCCPHCVLEIQQCLHQTSAVTYNHREWWTHDCQECQCLVSFANPRPSTENPVLSKSQIQWIFYSCQESFDIDTPSVNKSVGSRNFPVGDCRGKSLTPSSTP